MTDPIPARARIPIEVPTQATVAFLTSHIARGTSVLEVGSGAGDVAEALAAQGIAATCVDPDPDQVAAVRARGLPATCAHWPDYEGPAVDAVIFTRSLHHIDDLEGAVRRASELLRPDGFLLLEDFDFPAVDPQTVGWFQGVLHSATARRLLLPQEDEFATRIASASDPLDAWRQDHHHHLHSFAQMVAHLEEHFVVRARSEAPYLYRYLVPVLPPTEEAARLVEDVLGQEQRGHEAGALRWIGRRVVACAPHRA